MATTPNPTTDPPDPAPISEIDLARTLGVSRDDLKKLRAQLTHGVDWTGGNGTQVMITVEGQKKLARMVTAGSAETGTGEAIQRAAEAARQPDRYVSLTILRISNPRVLIAKKDGAEVRVMTKPSDNFRPGMVLEKCEQSRIPQVFYYHGRLPRRPGKI